MKAVGKQKVNEDIGDIVSFQREAFADPYAVFSFNNASLDEIRDTCIFVLDTNSLLVPYTLGKDSLDEIRAAFVTLIDQNRFFVPAQVAKEYAKNRATKIADIYKQLSDKRAREFPTVAGYPLLQSLDEYTDVLSLEQTILVSIKEYRTGISKLLEQIKSWNWNDPVSRMYGELFVSKTILSSEQDSETIHKELERRKLLNIPPGYKDSGKDDSGIGDLAIWFTILEAGRKLKRDLVFVTGEEKADWWHRSDHQVLYPRFELIDEYREWSNGKSFHIIKLSELLKLLGSSDKATEEVRREEATQQLQRSPSSTLGSHSVFDAKHAVYRWAANFWSTSHITPRGQRDIDFIVEHQTGEKIGLEIRFIRNPRVLFHAARTEVYKGHFLIAKGEINSFYLIIVFDSLKYLYSEDAEETIRKAKQIVSEIEYSKLVLGYIAGDGEFLPIEI